MRRNDRSQSYLPPILPPRGEETSEAESFMSEELPPIPHGYGGEDFFPHFEDDDEMESLGSDEEDHWDDFEEVKIPEGLLMFL